MKMFLHDLELLLEWAQGTHDIDSFEKEFIKLVHEHRMEDGVKDIAEVVTHNYNCHKFNRTNALIYNMDQWDKYNTKEA